MSFLSTKKEVKEPKPTARVGFTPSETSPGRRRFEAHGEFRALRSATNAARVGSAVAF